MSHQIQKKLQYHPNYRIQTLNVMDVSDSKDLFATYFGHELNQRNNTSPNTEEPSLVTIWVVNINQGVIAN